MHQADGIQLWRTQFKSCSHLLTVVQNAADKTLGNNQVRLLGYDLNHNPGRCG